MKEIEIIAQQKQSGNKKLYLMKVGMFYHAYNAAAFALAHLMHYKVKRRHRRCGDVLVAGFPVSGIEKAINKIVDVGGSIDKRTDDMIIFTGVDTSADESMIANDTANAVNTSVVACSPLIDAIKNFDLMNSSPMNAMHFILVLKSMINKQ